MKQHMALDIVFGWHLDGPAYPEAVTGGEAHLGGMILGPARLAEHLAMRLGVSRRIVPQAVRIARYLQALQSNDNGSRFYSKSLSVDPWSTASCLLVMRDQLLSAGWNGKQLGSENSKLHSIAVVEADIGPDGLGSPAEQLRAVATALASGQSPQVLPLKRIRIATPKQLLPAAWQRLLDLISERNVRIEPLPQQSAYAAQASDIRKIHNFLTSSQTTSIISSPLSNDGSFCLLEADDEYQLSDVTAAWLQSNEAAWHETTILRGAPSLILDSHLNKYGLPRIGSHESSRWRSTLQVLPLMLETCWLPANPYRTLELISLPLGPIPKSLSYHFVQALRLEPGFRGEAWRNAWRSVEETLAKEASTRFGEAGPAATAKIRGAVQKLKQWLEPRRNAPETGMSLEQALGICSQVSRWASANLRAGKHTEMFSHALSLANELSETLKLCGLQKINKIQMGRMLDAVFGEGCKAERWRAQAAPWSLVDHPGQIWGLTHKLLWWGFGANSVDIPLADPWTRAERQILADQEIFLETPGDIAVREAATWRQAILNTQQELVLCRTRSSKGKPVAAHPLWHELEEIASSNVQTTLQCHDVLATPRPEVGKRVVQLSVVPQRLPPQAHRDWRVPSNKLIQRQEESVTSLKGLFGCPMAWALRYYAQLHTGALLSLPDGEHLSGQLAHQLFQRIFRAKTDHFSLSIKADQTFEELLHTVGLPLTLRGRRFERAQTKRLMMSAVRQFSQLLKDHGLRVVACELHRTAPFLNGQFRGDFDVLLENGDGERIILDYKWSKSVKFRLQEIEAGQHLQLAAYAWLEHFHSGSTPSAGYYMVRQRRLLQSDDGQVFLSQPVISNSLEQVWKQAEEAYKANIDELQAGRLCATGIPSANSSSQTVSEFKLDPPCRICDYRNICGRGTLGDD